jgi:ribonuclease P protein component
VGNAVVRNKVKRRLREVFRHLRPSLEGIDVLVLAKPGLASSSLESIRHDIQESLEIWKTGGGGNRRGRRKKRDHRRKTG